jgi:hypothetical protein
MTLEMRRKLAAESYEEKIRKVGMLVRLVKSAPKIGKLKSGGRGATRPTY